MKNYINHIYKALALCMTTLALPISAQVVNDNIELRTTTIKGNTELPKILYVVPWQDINESEQGQQKLVLHSLFGDLFDPIAAKPPKAKKAK